MIATVDEGTKDSGVCINSASSMIVLGEELKEITNQEVSIEDQADLSQDVRF